MHTNERPVPTTFLVPHGWPPLRACAFEVYVEVVCIIRLHRNALCVLCLETCVDLDNVSFPFSFTG